MYLNSNFLIQKLNLNFRGKETLFDIKFNPRTPGKYVQEWNLEHHIKGCMGLAKTLKKIQIKASGKTRVSQAIRANPTFLQFSTPVRDEANSQ